MQTSAGKVLASVFRDAQAILFLDYLEKRRTINNEYYIALFVSLKEEIDKKWPHMKKEKVLFHQDNAPCHKYQFVAMITKLHELHFELLQHPLLFSRSGPQQQLAICRPQKNAPGKKVWLQWRSDIGNRCILRPKRNHSTKKSLNC